MCVDGRSGYELCSAKVPSKGGACKAANFVRRYKKWNSFQENNIKNCNRTDKNIVVKGLFLI